MSNDRTATVLRSLAALLALLALAIGVPAFLAIAIGWPLPHGLPNATDISDALTGRNEIADDVWLRAAACLAWVMWARVTVAVIAETVAAFRGRPAGAHGVRRSVAPIVTAALLLLGSVHRPQAAAAAPALPVVIAAAPAAPAPSAPAPRSAAPVAPTTWTVQRNDSLWHIAEAALGDPMRWKEIYDLNRAHPQLGGGVLTDPGLLRPGWILTLPADANTTAPSGATVTVEPGDTLSGIAQAALGDASEYPELFAANEGVRQPDGGALEDPNLIRPGWQLTIPTSAPSADAAPVAPPTPSPPLPSDAAPVSTTPPPPPTTPATTMAAATVSTATGSADDGVDLTVPVVATAGSTVTAAALIAALRRRRRRQQALRRPGATIPASADPAVREERRLRLNADHDALAWVAVTNRLLGRALADVADPPAVVLVQVGPDGVEVLLDRPQPAAPPFFADTSESVWHIAAGHSLDALTELTADNPAIAPTLVSVGATAEGTVLLNLEHAGTLTVTGDNDAVGAWLRGAVLELTTAPWATDVPVHVSGAALPASSDLEIDRHLTAAAASQAAARRGALLRDALDGRLPRAARLRDSDEAWLPAVAIMADATATEPALPDSGHIVITTSTDALTAFRLVFDESGGASLQPLDLTMHAVGVAAPAADAFCELVADAEAEPVAETQPAEAALPADVAPSIDDINAILSPRPVEVRVLRGDPIVAGWAEPSKLRGKSAELVVYLAVAGEPVGSQRLRNDLWSGELVANDTWKSTHSRARVALGHDDANLPRLPLADEHRRLTLSADVGCDWTRAKALVALANGSPPDLERRALVAALELIDGQPFSECPNRYLWAEDQVTEMERVLTDAAQRLAELAMLQADPDLATWAIERGHAVNPDQQALFDSRMLARGLAGDSDGVRATYAAMHAARRAVDPFSEPDDDAEDTYATALRLAETDDTQAAG